MSESTDAIEMLQFLKVATAIVLAGAIAAFVTYNLTDRSSQDEIACALACNSKDMVVRYGKCGCIAWKESK
jgi:hypothetical protein